MSAVIHSYWLKNVKVVCKVVYALLLADQVMIVVATITFIT